MFNFKIDKKKIEDILNLHSAKTVKKAVELSQKKTLQKLKTQISKDIREEYNIKKSDLDKKMVIQTDYKAIANKEVISSPYMLQIKDKRLGFAVTTYKKETSELEPGAIRIKMVQKFPRFKTKNKKRKNKNGTTYLAVSVEVKKGQVKDLLPGHAVLALANNYYGAFARGRYIGKQFAKGKDRYPFSRLWTLSAGNMFNTVVKKNKKIYDTTQKEGFEKEMERLIKVYSQKYQKH